MNEITRRSFYSFLTLYLLSSFIFLSLASYWFYTAQVSTEMNSNYYKMSNVSNKVSSNVIYAHMMKRDFKLQAYDGSSVALFDANKKLKYGLAINEIDFEQTYYVSGNTFTHVSKNTTGHLGIEYVVVQSNECVANVMKLKNGIIFIAIMVAMVIVVIAVFLSYMFLKPIKEKMQEIEEFVKDATHELNTPITALLMSASRAKEKKVYDEKIIQNISISSKQLYDIYSSLSFLSFDNASEAAQELQFDEVVANSIKHFDELLQKKRIKLTLHSQPCTLNMAPTKAKMLVNNLLSNAIKYSHPNTKIEIWVKKESFRIKDEGIGIEKEKLDSIFQRFTRANSYAGGFGVGLNIVENVLKEYDYAIEIDSTPGVGTSVTLEF